MHSSSSVLINQAALLNRKPGTQRELSDLKSDFSFDVLVGPGTQKLKNIIMESTILFAKQ